MVRIRKRKLVGEIWETPSYAEWWEAGGIVIEEYNTWEKIVTVAFEGKELRINANDVQLVSRAKTDK
jgi:hypothetical protein